MHQRAELDLVAATDRPDGELRKELVAVPVKRGDLDPLADQPPLARGEVMGEASPVCGALRDGDDGLLEPLAEGFLAGPAEGGLRLRVPVDDHAPGVDRDVGLAGAVDDQARLLLARTQGQLRLLLGRDVDHETAKPRRLAVLVADDDLLVTDPDPATVTPAHAVVDHAPIADRAPPSEVLCLDHPL